MIDVVDLFPNRRRYGIATVLRKVNLSPHMIRITLGSDFISRFPQDCAGGHLKLIVPPANTNIHAFRAAVEAGTFKQSLRTYTIRHIRAERNEIDIDFVSHGSQGIAGPWATKATLGNQIALSMPGTPKLKNPGVSRFLIAADMAGIPAAAAGLESLPRTAQGAAWFEILDRTDIQPIIAPQGVSVNWVVKTDPAETSDELIEAVKKVRADKDVSVFVAGEVRIAGTLRDHFRKDFPVSRDLLYVSSYWKNGVVEEEHKKVKVAV